jgi:hypothetical protein
VNFRTREGWTALVGAADKGHYAVVRTLLQHPETDPNTRDNQGKRGGWQRHGQQSKVGVYGGPAQTALVSAADKGHYAMVQHPETDPNTRDNQGERGWMTAPGATE